MVSTLRCGYNNPGSNPGLGKYYILYTVLHPYKLYNESGSKETLYCFCGSHSGLRKSLCLVR